jgi:hypothetical protein
MKKLLGNSSNVPTAKREISWKIGIGYFVGRPNTDAENM